MAKSNKKGNGSLIVTWVLIVLLAIGTFFVVMNYNDNHSDLIKNEEIALALTETFDKPIGRISEEDLASIEGVLFYKDLPFAMNGTTTQSMSAIEFYLEGYSDAVEAYNAEDITEEEKAKLTNPDTLAGYAQIMNTDILDDLKKLTNLKSFLVYNYGEKDTETDMLKFAADNYAGLEELTVFGYTTADFGVVSGLTNLTSLSVIDDAVTDISAVKSLAKLEILAINEAAELKDISAVAGLTGLKNLSVSGTSVADISAVAKLTNLEQLDLSNNKITDISALSALNNDKLEVLYITGNEIADYSPIKHLDADKVTSDEPEEEEEAEEESEASLEEAEETAEATEE